MTQRFSNGARANLNADIADSDTSLTIDTGGSLFPVANTDAATIDLSLDWFKLVLQDATNFEIVYVRTHTSGSTTFSNILRGQEGTTARAFATLTVVAQRPTAGDAAAYEIQAKKDTSGGYAGLSGFMLKLRNDADTFTSFLKSTVTAARIWTMQDKDGTVAMLSDITGTNSGTNTGDQINISGNAVTVTTNANLTGEVTSVGNAATVPNATVINKVLTGFASGAGTVTATDTILQAINKLNGNDTLKAGLTANTFTGIQTFVGVKGTKTALGASDIDFSLGEVFTKTVSGTTTLTVSNVPAAGLVGAFILELTNAGSATLNLPANSKLIGGLPFTSLTSAGKDIFFVYVVDGTNLNWFLVGKDVK